jgi:hypothetical protein
MQAFDLKTLLAHRISQIDDLSLLKAPKTILDTKTETGIIELTPGQPEDIVTSEKDIRQGKRRLSTNPGDSKRS